MEGSSFFEAATEEQEVRVVVDADGQEVRTPIWIVTAGDAVYVRSYKAAAGRWYQHVRSLPLFVVEIAGEDVTVAGHAVADEAVLRDVDDAYLTKYAESAETPDMVTPEVRQTTLRLEPVA